MGLASADQPDLAIAEPRSNVLFARQPLLDVDGRLAGYELLYRGELPGSPHAATSQVAAAALSDLGLKGATGGALAFLNVTSEFLLAMDPMPFGPDGVVLEISPAAAVDAAVIARLLRLSQHGYQLAVDGFAGQPTAEALLPTCTFAKVQVDDVPPQRLGLIAAHLRARGLRPVAMGVSSHELQQRCRDAGFELFQGDYVCRPRPVVGHEPPAASIGAVRLAASISSAQEGDVDELERTIALDPALSLRLMRFINSASFSLRHEIRSVRQAIALVGARTVRQWATLILLSGVDAQRGPLLTTALSRGRTCETIAERLGADDVSAYFFAGMMSVADALLNVPMQEAIADLPLGADVAAALLTRGGGKGRTLLMAEACERGDWDAVALPTLDAGELAVLHTEALSWADATAAGLS